MQENIQTVDRLYENKRSIIVNVIGYNHAGQRVIYCRRGCDWECVAPLIVFLARFRRIDK